MASVEAVCLLSLASIESMLIIDGRAHISE